MKKIEWSKLIFAVLICELVGVIGSVFTAPNIEGWYALLVKPAFAPPSWVFAPAWITLYALMGIAAYLVWRFGIKRRDVKMALPLFGIQLLLNALWSPLFFGLKSPIAGLMDIILLWLAILATIVAFAKISKSAAWLLVPYLLWVSFATLLNYAIWSLN